MTKISHEPPLISDMFKALMADVSASLTIKHIAVACSGGPDSMALALLLKEWCAEHSISLTALIVDHMLRPESSDEAGEVKLRLVQHDIKAEILTALHDGVTTNIQSRARDLRYKLMLDWCEERKVPVLALGHHLQDQAETFLLRLARGSGVFGLAAMRKMENRGGVTLLRPLLDMDKSSLLSYLKTEKVSWVDDPSNESERFSRVRMRKMADQLDQEGLTAGRLSKTASLMQKSQDALDWALLEKLKPDLKIYDVGAYSVSLDLLKELPEALTLRALSLMLKTAGGQIYAPRLEKLSNLYMCLMDHKMTSYAGTSFGAQLRLSRGRLWVGREVSKVDSLLQATAYKFLWDDRFEISLNLKTLNGNISVGHLGLENWKKWAKSFSKNKDDCIFPSFIRQSVPAIYRKQVKELKFICPMVPIFGCDSAEISKKTTGIEIKFKIPKEFSNFTFSSAPSDTM